VIVALGLLAIIGLVFWVVARARRPRPVLGRIHGVRLLGVDRPFPVEGRFPSDPYIGSKVCGECHPGEVALHSRSGHALTLRLASRRAVSRRLDGTTVADPESRDVLWRYRYRDGQLRIAREVKGQVEECIAEYAFGSGHHGVTFVSIIDPEVPVILEHRLTYFTRDDSLGLTPGHDTKPPPPGMTARGGVPPPSAARKCFECHATQISTGESRSRGIDEQAIIPNVSCERCHGPGRAHVAAARRGATDSELALPLGLGRFTAETLLEACGACHRHPAGPRPEQIRPDDPAMPRFQPIGLMQSKCYRQSGGSLSCLTCHDPHARASSDRAGYDVICLKCHSGSASPAGAAPSAPAAAVGCSVSPRARCVECHMPRVGVDGGEHVLLSDHWIRIRGRAPSTAPSQSAASQ
jgi:hypothetical protein